MLNINSQHEEIISILKAQQWQKIKGELYAFFALEGCRFPESIDGKIDMEKFDKLKQLIDTFINEIEEEGFQE